jgi:signal transduction histidine kinase
MTELARSPITTALTEPTAAAGRSAPPPVLDPPALMPDHVERPGRESWTLRRTFTVGAALTALLMIAVVVLGGVMLARLTEARTQLLDEIGPVVRAYQDLAVAQLNEETGVRGYALTGRDEFLGPYRAGIDTEATTIGVLRKYLRGDSGSTAQADAVEAAAQAWRAGYAEPIIASRSAGAADPAAGKALFDALRARMNELNAVLDVERLDARGRLNDAAAALRWVGIGIAAVLAAFLAVAAWGLSRGVLVPIAALADQVREVVSGDVRRKVRATGPREIVELGADIDAMRVHISNEVDVLQEVNRRLDEQARDLERSNRDLEQFAYVASHDLQEPLRKVSSFCQLLERRYGGKLDDRADQYIGFAVDGAQRMQRLINDLLSFSRVGRSAAGFEPVDLREIGLAAAAQLETTRSELDGEIVVGDLPRVQGDPVLLRQMLLNLFGNGLKFHRPDVAPVVRVDAQRVGENWELTVTDNGIGVEAEYAEKIFVIFQRLHGRDVYTGTGIGLALVKKIVEFHDGRVWLDTAPRADGAVIRFTLPVADTDLDPVAADEAAEPTPQEQS